MAKRKKPAAAKPVAFDLLAWVHDALDLAVDCFGAGDHTPIIMLRLTDGQGHMIDFKSASGNIDAELIESARDLIRQWAPNGECYLLAWDGYLTTDGKRQDAAFAEVGARGEEYGSVFAQCYKQGKSGARKVGKPVCVAQREHLWGQNRAEG